MKLSENDNSFLKDVLIFFNENLQVLGFLLTIIAVGIYYKALRSSIYQNKISVSASMLQHYSNEINNIMEYGKRKEIQYMSGNKRELFNVFDFHFQMKTSLDKLEASNDFQLLRKKIEPFNGITISQIKRLSFYNDMSFLSDLNNLDNQLMTFLIRSFDLLANVDDSKIVLDPHKTMLKLEIYNNLLKPMLDKFRYEGKGWHIQYSNLKNKDNAAWVDFQHSNFQNIFWNFRDRFKDSPELWERLTAGNKYFKYLKTNISA